MGDISTSSTVQCYDNCGIELQEVKADATNHFDDGINIAVEKRNDINNCNDSMCKPKDGDDRNEINTKGENNQMTVTNDDDDTNKTNNNVSEIHNNGTNDDDDTNNKTNDNVSETHNNDGKNDDKTDSNTNDNRNNDAAEKNNQAIVVLEEDITKTFEYDVFISYSCSDRPWVKDVLLQTLEQEGKTVCIDYRDFTPGQAILDNVVHAVENSRWTILVLTPAFVSSEWCMYESKHALMSSLAASRARVLPLILMECAIPNMLKHLTYLDHTSEDVQPYFNKQLIESLDKAKIWSPKKVQTDQLSGGDIVPMSEVENVVTRTFEQKDERKNAHSKLTGAYERFQRLTIRIKRCIIAPCVCVLVIYIILIGLSFASFILANWISYVPLEKRALVDDVFTSFSVYDVKGKALDYCQMIGVRNEYGDVMVDIHTFNVPLHDVIYARTLNTRHIKTYLPRNRQYKYKTSLLKTYEFSTTTFCYSSRGKTDLWVYTSPITKQPSSKYRVLANTTHCNKTKEDNDIVFSNPGSVPIFLNVSTTINTITYRQNLTERSCLNSSECKVPTPPKFVIIPRTYAADKNPIAVRCVYTLSKTIFVLATLSILIGLCVLLRVLTKCYKKKCVPCLKKWYFKRETIRERLGEAAVSLLDEADDLDEFFEEVEKENKKYIFV